MTKRYRFAGELKPRSRFRHFRANVRIQNIAAKQHGVHTNQVST